MEELTLGQISVAIAFFVALITGVKYLLNEIKKALEMALKPTNDKIDRIDAKVDKVDKNATMNYIVRCFTDIDRGTSLDSASIMRLKDQYEHYIKDLNGNTYIHDEYERLKKEGKL